MDPVHWWDLLLVVIVILPGPMLYWHGMRALRKGATAVQVGAIAAAYQFTCVLPIAFVIGTDLNGRASEQIEGLGLALLWLPMLANRLITSWPAYLLDRKTRESHWTYMEFIRTTHLDAVLIAIWILLTIGSLWLIDSMLPRIGMETLLEENDLLAGLLGAAVPLASLPLLWLIWRRLQVRPEPPHPELESRLRALGARLGCTFGKIEVLPMRGGRIANALVTGTRRSKQTLYLTDALIEHFTYQEIEAIFAHEAAHSRLKHVQKRLAAVLGVMLLAGGLIAAWAWLGVEWFAIPPSLAFLPMLLVGLSPMIAAGPMMRRQELEADRWAAEALGDPHLLADTLERLDRFNQVKTEELPLWIRLISSHPLTPLRVAALRSMTRER